MAGETYLSREYEPPVLLLIPCSGRDRLGLPRGHVLTLAAGAHNEYSPLAEFQASYPYSQLVVSPSSDGLCETCFEDINGVSRR